MHASDRIRWAGTSSHGAANPAYAMYCQQRALPASVLHAVLAFANAQEIRFGKMLVARRPQIEALLKRGCHALSQPARCSPASLASLGVRKIAGPCGAIGAPGRCRTARPWRSAGPPRTRRTSGRGGIAGACRSARSARRRRTAGTSRPEGRRGTGRTQGRSRRSRTTRPTRPRSHSRAARLRTPAAIASPAKKTKSWSPQSARTPAVRLSSRGQRCAARDQRESSASACASRNSGPSITMLCGEACLALASGASLHSSWRRCRKPSRR